MMACEADGDTAMTMEWNDNQPIYKQLRDMVDAGYPDRVLLCEANQWPEDAAAYFGDGDECHMNFHFPLMPRLYLALERENRLPIIDILDQTPTPPEHCQWATFLRNHDELTLEMVSEEERDLMWRTYAPDRRARLNLGIRRRLAPLLLLTAVSGCASSVAGKVIPGADPGGMTLDEVRERAAAVAAAGASGQSL